MICRCLSYDCRIIQLFFAIAVVVGCYIGSHDDVAPLAVAAAAATTSTKPTSSSCTTRQQQQIQPLQPPNFTTISQEQIQRFQSVQSSIQYAWKGYMNVVKKEQQRQQQQEESNWLVTTLFPHYYHPPDDLQPITQTGLSWLYYSATLHDSIDTLYIAQLHKEYQQAKQLLLYGTIDDNDDDDNNNNNDDAGTRATTTTKSSYYYKFDYQTITSHFFKPTKIFEYSLRVIGGMLGSYSVTGDIEFLLAAQRATDAILSAVGPFAFSKTRVLPRNYHILSPSLVVAMLSSSSSSTSSTPTTTTKPTTKLTKHSLVFHLSSIRRSVHFVLGILPRYIFSMIYGYGRDLFVPNEHIENSLAGIGSFGLEFKFLSYSTDQALYEQTQDTIYQVLESYFIEHGELPILWNVQTGKPSTTEFSQHQSSKQKQRHTAARGFVKSHAIGSGADSFYEYLTKIPILKECVTRTTTNSRQKNQQQQAHHHRCSSHDESMILLYNQFVEQELIPNHVLYYEPTDSSSTKKTNATTATTQTKIAAAAAYPVDDHNTYDHLLCFIPGMLGLGVYYGVSQQIERDLTLAKQLLYGCYDTYQQSTIGLGPEMISFQQRKQSTNKKEGHVHISSMNRNYLLRPEVVESLFVLYRITKDPIYQEWAWNIHQSIETYCKYENEDGGGGYTGIKDVTYDHKNKKNNDDKYSNLIDDMPSYFIAETLKYLLLIFSPDDYVSLDDYVFTTEGHPLRIQLPVSQKQKQQQGATTSTPCHDSIYEPPLVPIPWLFLSVVLLVIALSILLGFSCFMVRHKYRRYKKQKKRWLDRKQV